MRALQLLGNLLSLGKGSKPSTGHYALPSSQRQIPAGLVAAETWRNLRQWQTGVKPENLNVDSFMKALRSDAVLSSEKEQVVKILFPRVSQMVGVPEREAVMRQVYENGLENTAAFLSKYLCHDVRLQFTPKGELNLSVVDQGRTILEGSLVQVNDVPSGRLAFATERTGEMAETANNALYNLSPMVLQFLRAAHEPKKLAGAEAAAPTLPGNQKRLLK
jgi:hypothetical protein